MRIYTLLMSLTIALLCNSFVDLQAVFVEVYTNTTNGGIAITGNTLGLCKATGAFEPGINDSIGAFISTNQANQVGTFPKGTDTIPPGIPAGTVLPFSSSSSQATLDLPPGSTVLFANLVWSGGYGFDPAITVALINSTNVTLIDPLGNTHSIAPIILPPPSGTAQEAVTPGFPGMGNYVRSQDVTSIVQAAGAGNYIVGGVPASLVINDETHNCAGWTLVVAYSNPQMLTSNLTIFTGCEQASSALNVPAAVTGFCTPSEGPIHARIFISAAEGDADKGGDFMLFGPSPVFVLPTDELSGDNNPQTNFFCSQVNTLLTIVTDPATGKLKAVGSANLDERGSFGTRNSDPFTLVDEFAGRQGWDITSIDVSSLIANSETQAFAQGTVGAGGDDYTLNTVALQIQVNAPIILATKAVDGVDSVNKKLGETVHFSVSFSNTGTETAMDVMFIDNLQTGLTYVDNSFKLNGVLVVPTVSGQAISSAFGNLIPGASFLVEYDALINSVPANCTLSNQAFIDYDFVACPALNLTPATTGTNLVNINVDCTPAPIDSPTNFVGRIKKCKSLDRTRLFLDATWVASLSPDIVAYRIYLDGNLVATIPSTGPLEFKTPIKSKKAAANYTITAVNSAGVESAHLTIRIK